MKILRNILEIEQACIEYFIFILNFLFKSL